MIIDAFKNKLFLLAFENYYEESPEGEDKEDEQAEEEPKESEESEDEESEVNLDWLVYGTKKEL